MVLVVGAEGPGLSEAALAQTDLPLTIPMEGAVESLNATVSAAVVLFERYRRLHHSHGKDRDGDSGDVGGNVGAPTSRP